ncbi:unnamed protein product [Protopolystoma xenopodis]|uniref:Uncharacterized protein n=1 Tax=Protopolystoma xenopodis TaxID=117903 RepID=A0A3S5B5H3_9PLAT|nr:unnamed protein product [Protopolystoma xenopodis]
MHPSSRPVVEAFSSETNLANICPNEDPIGLAVSNKVGRVCFTHLNNSVGRQYLFQAMATAVNDPEWRRRVGSAWIRVTVEDGAMLVNISIWYGQ